MCVCCANTLEKSLEYRQSSPLLTRHAESHGELFPKNCHGYSSFGIIATEILSHGKSYLYIYSSLLGTGKCSTLLCSSQRDTASLL